MSVHTIEEVGPTRRKLKITIPADDVQKSWDKVVKEVQASAEVRGFRKGKAPLSPFSRLETRAWTGGVHERGRP